MAFNKWLKGLFKAEAKASEVPFPKEWREILRRNVSLYENLAPEDATRLERWVHGFLEQIPFEGCSGLEVTDEMRITIAGWASLLVLNRDHAKYPYLHRVLVYPDGYRITEGGFFFPEQDTGFDASGESWEDGYVILAWADCLKALEPDGFNVVLHEFAHQLDLEGGDIDGVPVTDPDERVRWLEIVERDFDRFVDRLADGRPSALDDYGAEDRVEFFAVATEAFFHRAEDLQSQHPDLYDLLKGFFGFDPAALARSFAPTATD